MLIGYLSTMGCRAGDSLDVMVSSSTPDVTLDVVRLLHGDENPLGPGFIYQDVPQFAPLSLTGLRELDTPIGSYAITSQPLTLGGHLALEISVWPTLPGNGQVQGLFSLPGVGLELVLDVEGKVAMLRHGELQVVSDQPLKKRTWYRVRATIDATASHLHIDTLTPGGSASTATCSGIGGQLRGASHLLLAAVAVRWEASQRFARGVYSGKLAAPCLSIEHSVIAQWAFEQEMTTQRVPDVSGHGYHLDLVNVPTRAMTGPNWDNRVHCWEQAPAQYDAIHFHDDDLADAQWPVAARVTLPASLASGVYAVRLQAQGAAPDYIPLGLRPALGATPAKIALVLSTFTYLAYANERLTEGEFEQPSEIPVRTGPWEDLLEQHPQWGKSSYDLHSDGSGVAHSSGLRPIPNLRPTYRFWGFGAPRRFPADLYMVHFLHQRGEPFDILTEHDLSLEPATALAPYQTVITGTHPEYCSAEILDAYSGHVANGGGVMYLGGDGFYWVTTLMPALAHVIEVRKSEGLRHWDADPGERYHAGTAELGGLWRSRGRSTHAIFGIGMGAHGWDSKAPGYRRTAESYREDVAWVFEGIDEEVIGDFGLIMNGTSGDEIDRADYRYGTPEHTVILASSEPHSHWYVPVPEDVTTVSNQLNATFNRNVRSDMVLLEHESGGAVFSVGSIIFTGAVPVNGGDNNVAKLLANVLGNFTARGQ